MTPNRCRLYRLISALPDPLDYPCSETLSLGFDLVERSHQQDFPQAEVPNRFLRNLEHSHNPSSSHARTLQVACQSELLLNDSASCFAWADERFSCPVGVNARIRACRCRLS